MESAIVKRVEMLACITYRESTWWKVQHVLESGEHVLHIGRAHGGKCNMYCIVKRVEGMYLGRAHGGKCNMYCIVKSTYYNTVHAPVHTNIKCSGGSTGGELHL